MKCAAHTMDWGRNERTALETAAARIRDFHERQKTDGFSFRTPDGTELGQRVTPLDRAGLYVPGGKAAYPSSVLMNAIPAQVAGVGDIVIVVPTPGGVRNPLVLAAAHLAASSRVFTIGGAQAIAALAYGTETIPAVDKICGPGNAYVAAAKRRVFGAVGIDMIAGASEIVVIADSSANPEWVAIDLFSQAEHDEMAQAILLTPDRGLIERVADSAQRWFVQMPRAPIIAASLARRGALVKTRDLADACAIANRIAPEHLELAVADPDTLLPQLRHAGAIFIGHYASEALGDYCAGPNHVLPTGRTARFSSPLGVYDFQKRTSMLRIHGKPRRCSRRLRRRSPPAKVSPRTRVRRWSGSTTVSVATDERRRAASSANSAPAGGSAAAKPQAWGVIQALQSRLEEVHASRAKPRREARGARASRRRCGPTCARCPGTGRVRRRLGQARRDGKPVRAARSAAEMRSARRSHACRSTAIRTAMRAPSKRPCGRHLALSDDVGLMVGNGSDELIQILTIAVAAPRAVVLAPEPSFVMYRRNALISHARFVGVPLRRGFHARRRTRCWRRSSGNARRSSGSPIRTTRPATFPGCRCRAHRPRCAGRSSQSTKRITHSPMLRSCRACSISRMSSSCAPSRRSAWPGLRLGYAVAHPDWIHELEKIRPPYNVSSLTQAALPVLLRHADAFARQAAAIRPTACGSSGRWRRCPLSAIRDADEFRAGSRAGCPGLVCDALRRENSRQESRRLASAARELPANNRGDARGERRARRGTRRKYA